MPRPTGHRLPVAAQSIHHRPHQPSNSRAMTDTFTPSRLVALVLVAGLALGACGGTTSSTKAETDKQVMQRYEHRLVTKRGAAADILITHQWENPERTTLARHLAYLILAQDTEENGLSGGQRADYLVTLETLDYLVGLHLNGKSL